MPQYCPRLVPLAHLQLPVQARFSSGRSVPAWSRPAPRATMESLATRFSFKTSDSATVSETKRILLAGLTNLY